MCRRFIVVKHVLLCLLLCCRSGLTPPAAVVAYEYGYHPSAEEFDGVLRDTRRTWTHDILSQQTQRQLHKTNPSPTNEVRSYVPKFHIDNQKRHDENIPMEPMSILTSPALLASSHPLKQNLTSTFNFYFNNDEDENDNDLPKIVYSLDKPKKETENQIMSASNPLTEINLKPLTQPEIENFSSNNQYQQQNSNSSSSSSSSHGHFPIYFTNPATGIVYSITEMGKASENVTHSNGSIPIFITKDQYERDIRLLKQEYESKCHLNEINHNNNNNNNNNDININNNNNKKRLEFIRPSSFSRHTTTTSTTSTTVRPQIIRIQRPMSSAQSSIKNLTPLKKPAAIVVRKEITVNDPKISTPRPLRKKKKSKNKNKTTKRAKPPGHLRGMLSSTARPNVLGAPQWSSGDGPAIIKGTRATTTKRPYTESFKLSTQLEKPNFGTTIFSTEVLPPTASSEMMWSHHRLPSNNRKKRMVQPEVGKTINIYRENKAVSKENFENEINIDFNYESPRFDINFQKQKGFQLSSDTDDQNFNLNLQKNLKLKKELENVFNQFQPINNFENDFNQETKFSHQNKNKRSPHLLKDNNFLQNSLKSDKIFNLKSDFLFGSKNLNNLKPRNSETQFEKNLKEFLESVQKIKTKSKVKKSQKIHMQENHIKNDLILKNNENIEKHYVNNETLFDSITNPEFKILIENQNRNTKNDLKIKNFSQNNKENLKIKNETENKDKKSIVKFKSIEVLKGSLEKKKIPQNSQNQKVSKNKILNSKNNNQQIKTNLGNFKEKKEKFHELNFVLKKFEKISDKLDFEYQNMKSLNKTKSYQQQSDLKTFHKTKKKIPKDSENIEKILKNFDLKAKKFKQNEYLKNKSNENVKNQNIPKIAKVEKVSDDENLKKKNSNDNKNTDKNSNVKKIIDNSINLLYENDLKNTNKNKAKQNVIDKNIISIFKKKKFQSKQQQQNVKKFISDKYINSKNVSTFYQNQSKIIDNQQSDNFHRFNDSLKNNFITSKNFKNNFSKSLDFFNANAWKPSDGMKNFPNSFFPNEFHHIGKRSAALETKYNVGEPKFVKKSKNLTKENDFPFIDKTIVESTTIEPISAIDNPIFLSHENSSNANLIQSTSDLNNIEHKTQLELKDRSHHNSKTTKIKDSASAPINSVRAKNRKRKKVNKSRNRIRTLKKRKRIANETREVEVDENDSNQTETTTTRSIKEAVTKMVKHFLNGKKGQNKNDYNLFGMKKNDNEEDEEEDDDDDDEEDGDDDDDDDDEESDEDDDEDYDADDLKETPIRDTSSAEEGADFGALEEDDKTITPPPDAQNKIADTETETKITKQNIDNDIRVRIRRRPVANKKADDDYDDDDDEDEDDVGSSVGSNLGGFFRMIFYPVQIVMSSIMETFLNDKKPPQPHHNVYNYPQYTSYHNTLKQHSNDNADYAYDDENTNDYDYDSDSDSESSDSSLGGWLGSWFGLSRRNKKISSTTMAPSPAQRRPTKQSNNWFQSWFGTDGDNDGIDKTDTEDYDDYDKWFASWFGKIKPKARKRTTTTTTTTTQLPQVPILTIVDPMRNPQNWIGILAHHIINQTTTTTQNPLRDIWTRITTPETTTTSTTENPEIPRQISYNKYQIWRLKPQDDGQVQALEEYKKGDDGMKLQWLKGPSLRGLTDVLVHPRMLVDFQSSLTFESIDHEVLIFDVGKAIAYEKSKEDYFFTTTPKPKRKNQNRYANKPPPAAMTWMRYYEFDDIVTFMESMRMRYPQLVELIHIGRSYEGRPLIVMKIESKEAAASNSAQYTIHEKAKLRHKKRIGLANAAFIEAGVHGMEWIAPATATWIINELLKAMKTNKTSNDEANLIRNTTWFIMPVLNPDGYVYSHEYDRFWKKSRSRHIFRPSGLINSAMTWLQTKKTKDKVCFGVDLDRNWNYQWGKRGSSKSACNEFFSGPGPFSEPETKALSEFLMDYRTHIKLYISMQSYGQIISYPYKANTTYDAERLDDFLDVAMVGTDGLRKKGSKTRYKIDSTNDLVENRSGCSDAFVAYDVGIPFSYTLQLADNGVHGYLLPSSSIESTSRDAFEIIKAMLDYI